MDNFALIPNLPLAPDFSAFKYQTFVLISYFLDDSTISTIASVAAGPG